MVPAMRSQNWWAPKRAPGVRLKGESSSLTWNCPSGLILERSLTSNVRMQACARPRRASSSLALCAWSSSSMASAMRRLPLRLSPRLTGGGGCRKSGRMMLVAAGFWLRHVGDIDHAEAAVPAARPHFIAEAQRMVQAVAAARPAWRLAAGEVLPGHPPAPDLLRLLWVGEIVDDEDVANIAVHLGGDVGVA